jgi:flagellar hook-basal body complex protein FliE
MVNLNNNINGINNHIRGTLEQQSVQTKKNSSMPKVGGTDNNKTDFGNTVKAINNYISKVDDLQTSSDMSIKDLLSGKNEDITSVVSAVAKADLSFKLLVGVRNKIIEAYKQTMNMPL